MLVRIIYKDGELMQPVTMQGPALGRAASCADCIEVGDAIDEYRSQHLEGAHAFDSDVLAKRPYVLQREEERRSTEGDTNTDQLQKDWGECRDGKSQHVQEMGHLDICGGSRACCHSRNQDVNGQSVQSCVVKQQNTV